MAAKKKAVKALTLADLGWTPLRPASAGGSEVVDFARGRRGQATDRDR